MSSPSGSASWRNIFLGVCESHVRHWSSILCIWCDVIWHHGMMPLCHVTSRDTHHCIARIHKPVNSQLTNTARQWAICHLYNDLQTHPNALRYLRCCASIRSTRLIILIFARAIIILNSERKYTLLDLSSVWVFSPPSISPLSFTTRNSSAIWGSPLCYQLLTVNGRISISITEQWFSFIM